MNVILFYLCCLLGDILPCCVCAGNRSDTAFTVDITVHAVAERLPLAVLDTFYQD